MCSPGLGARVRKVPGVSLSFGTTPGPLSRRPSEVTVCRIMSLAAWCSSSAMSLAECIRPAGTLALFIASRISSMDRGAVQAAMASSISPARATRPMNGDSRGRYASGIVLSN